MPRKPKPKPSEPPKPKPRRRRRLPAGVEPEYRILEARQFRELQQSPAWADLYAGLLTRRSVPMLASRAAAMDPELAAMPRWTLLHRLYRLRNALPDGLMVALTKVDERYRRPGAGIDVLDEMDTLIRLQKERIAEFMETERSFPVPVEQMRREMATLIVMLEKRRDTAVMMGLHPGVQLQPSTVIDARSVNLSVGESTLEQLLDANPSAIPMVMAMLDGLEDMGVVDAGRSSAGGEGPDAGTAGSDEASVRPVGMGDREG